MTENPSIVDTDNPDSINRITFLTDFTRETVSGPFDFLRDAGNFEVTISEETLIEHNIHPDDLNNFVHATTIAFADGRIVGHGRVEVISPESEEAYMFAVDDPLYADPRTVSVDV